MLEDKGLLVEEGTLYPLLRRLETQGLLVSEWREEDKRTKRFYQLSGEGARMLDLLLAEWQAIDRSLTSILSESDHGSARPLSASS
jgi:PadR family transcriptional regulator PadR